MPEGSTYTGIDNDYFINKSKQNFKDCNFNVKFIESDIYSLEVNKEYDIAISQAGLRHMNKSAKVLEKMVESVKRVGLLPA